MSPWHAARNVQMRSALQAEIDTQGALIAAVAMVACCLYVCTQKKVAGGVEDADPMPAAQADSKPQTLGFVP